MTKNWDEYLSWHIFINQRRAYVYNFLSSSFKLYNEFISPSQLNGACIQVAGSSDDDV
jgi:hypothetical protein